MAQNQSDDQQQGSNEENIPFKDLIDLKGIRTFQTDTEEYKKKVKEYGDEVPPYDPYLSEGQIPVQKDYISEEKETPKPSVFHIRKQPTNTGEDQKEEKEAKLAQSGSQYKDEESILRESISYLSREQAELTKKLEYYEKSHSKVSEERKDFEIKKAELEKGLQPILNEEKVIEEEIDRIKAEEEAISNENQLRTKEKERWAKEDTRQEVEKKKWAQMSDIQTVQKFIEEKNETYQNLLSKESEAKAKIDVIRQEKGGKEAKLRLLQIKVLKQDIENHKNKLAAQLSAAEDNLAELSKNEKAILEQKEDLESKERETKPSKEQQALEAKRWEVESELRKIEEEKWQVSDSQKKMQEVLDDILEQYEKILKEEKIALSQISNSRNSETD